MKAGAGSTRHQAVRVTAKTFEFGSRQTDRVLSAVDFNADALDPVRRRGDDFGLLHDQTGRLHNLYVVSLSALHSGGVRADEVEVVNVHLIAQAVDVRVGVMCDAVGRAQCGACVEQVLVSELCHQHRVGPAHRQRHTARVHAGISTEARSDLYAHVTRPHCRERKVRAHPYRQPQAVIKVVEIDFGYEKWPGAVGAKALQKIGSRQTHRVEHRKESVGGPRVDDEAVGVLVFGHSENAANHCRRSGELYHPK